MQKFIFAAAILLPMAVKKQKVLVHSYVVEKPTHYKHHDKPRPKNYRGTNY